NLKSIGYQTGTGFMVGSPYQTMKHLAEDLLFIKDLEPEMVGIGPFIPHHDTVFKDSKRDSVRLTLVLISILRLMIPNLLIPTTTALGSIDSKGRELGILAGANVIMPNLSPEDVRKKYLLYDNKISTGMETAEGVLSLKKSMKALGYEILPARGDFKPMNCDKKVKEMS
ncbi:MAG TPA: [FeFe] hydrogenase H-cluster radical SAM maturase HydE, partial [Anaerovoracaceae bacterium]|nr:[FeFe] hydrogenase H-cluster radical SAM maturase HydE [Anaerovoracaceae bacterium]